MAEGKKRNRILVLSVVVVVVVIGVYLFLDKPGDRDPDPVASKRGELIYQVNGCATCHGSEGHGDGVAAVSLRPPPRDFAMRPWRGEVSQDAIRRVIQEGIPGTAMPESPTNGADLDSLVEYVHHLATSRPTIAYQPSAEEKLLSEAKLVDLRGIDPPSLTLTDAQETKQKLSDLKGKLVILHFWGKNCLPCLKEMPNLQKLEKEFANRSLIVLNICTDVENAEEAQDFLAEQIPEMKTWCDESGLGLARFEVKLLPTIWLIDKNGKAIARSHGARDWQAPEFRKVVEAWLP